MLDALSLLRSNILLPAQLLCQHAQAVCDRGIALKALQSSCILSLCSLSLWRVSALGNRHTEPVATPQSLLNSVGFSSSHIALPGDLSMQLPGTGALGSRCPPAIKAAGLCCRISAHRFAYRSTVLRCCS